MYGFHKHKEHGRGRQPHERRGMRPCGRGARPFHGSPARASGADFAPPTERAAPQALAPETHARLDRCPLCDKHCPLDDPGCGKGKAYAAKQAAGASGR